MIIMCLGLGFPGGLSHHHLPHIKQEFDRPPGLISHHQGGEDTKHDSPKKKVCIAATRVLPFGSGPVLRQAARIRTVPESLKKETISSTMTTLKFKIYIYSFLLNSKFNVIFVFIF